MTEHNELAKLGRNIHIALFDKKMTKSELAEKVGVSLQMISAIVQGDKLPSSVTLVKISQALDTTVDALIK
jgi:transcriptional regulator with XRE-family HTH domain